MAKVDANYRMSKTLKRLLSAGHSSWKNALMEAEAHASNAERMTMMYDVAPNGKRARAKD